MESRYATSPNEAKQMDTETIRKNFLIENIFSADEVTLLLTHYDRLIVGGAMPVSKTICLPNPESIRSTHFLERRELGIINMGGKGIVTVDGTNYELNYKEALYIGKGKKEITFKSLEASKPALFYMNSAPAHTEYPVKKVTMAEAEIAEVGSDETANRRTINKLLIESVLPTCRLQMGLTEFHPGSVWNTMPAHTHDRRMEAYFYFNIPDGQAVCHFMGEPSETRHIWVHNNQAVISPSWSIHSGVGTANYAFIWGMTGENLDYTDMDACKITNLQ